MPNYDTYYEAYSNIEWEDAIKCLIACEVKSELGCSDNEKVYNIELKTPMFENVCQLVYDMYMDYSGDAPYGPYAFAKAVVGVILDDEVQAYLNGNGNFYKAREAVYWNLG